MKHIEEYIVPTQAKLFKMLCRDYQGKALKCKDSFILVKGNAPIMLVAHLDTVHAEPVQVICKSADGNILMSPQGIGGDDRCGVYALNKIYEQAAKKPFLLFTCDEEIGGVGADQFCYEYELGVLPKELNNLKCLIEIDRKGANDAVYYNCDNAKFEKYISSKGFKTASGSFSDISVIAPTLGVAAVNLSSGYYNAHTQHEYINLAELETTINKVAEIVDDASTPNFPKFHYVPKKDFLLKFSKTIFDAPPTEPKKNLPKGYEREFLALLDIYYEKELREYCKEFGNDILSELYRQEFGHSIDNEEYIIFDEGYER